MESKTVTLALFVMSLVMAQTQIEAKTCCPTSLARIGYNSCRFVGNSRQACAALSGCKIVIGGTCPPGFPNDSSDNVVNEYCKLGCVSSACGAITTLQSTDKSEIVNGAVGQCTKACVTLCTKGSITTPETTTA